jgi:hypothetical protein
MGIASEFPGKNVRTVGRREPRQAATDGPELPTKTLLQVRRACVALDLECVQLMAQARRGDAAAVDQLLRRYRFRYVA